MFTILNIVGARPNFMKIAPIHRAMLATGRISPILVHTGQHYDDAMSRVFFEEFGLPAPHHHLGVGSGTHAEQTARVMLALEPVIGEVAPDCVLVVGDVNSTIAATLTAVKLNVPTGHVEAGLRSFDRTMPEEINRLLTDAIADLLFAPSRDGVENLRNEGIPEERIHLVGNVMIDTLDRFVPRAERSTILGELGVSPKSYVLSTLHRPSNVDDPRSMDNVVEALMGVRRIADVILVAHPRTRERLQAFGRLKDLEAAGVRVLEPVGYIDFLRLMIGAGAALTDSGGIQEETTVLGVPCITMRRNTERPITVTDGTNRLVGLDPTTAIEAVEAALRSPTRPHRPELWDGHTAERIVEILVDQLGP